MPGGDGLIVRLRLTNGILVPALARQIAHWSRQWGNGQIDLTNRANLQLRGLTPAHLPDLQHALAHAGLLDASPAAEAVRNVIASPLADLDPTAILDTRPIVAALEHRLGTDASLHALPGKFGFAVDDGGLFPLHTVPADVRFVARPGPAFTIHLAGSTGAFGPVYPGEIPDVAAAIAHAFLRHPNARRIRDLPAEAIGLTPTFPPQLPTPRHPLGAHALGAAAVLGVGLPFGRISAEDLIRLAAVAPKTLRLSPWRAILIPLPSLPNAHALAAALDPEAFILDPTDPRCRIAACPGAPDCAQGTTRTRADAAALAAHLQPGFGIALHLSGCQKGCAHPHPAPITLVARNGRYDLIRNGTAAASPSVQGLTLAQAASYLP
jgi:precorrin-3B synthase